jgi:hypothetical protein
MYARKMTTGAASAREMSSGVTSSSRLPDEAAARQAKELIDA